MKCNNCEEHISVGSEAEVSEANGKIDLQIHCRKCGCNHFTYVAIEDLCDDAETTT
jgi:predicted  nucleic acid-binding Zn-ribbon protein